MQVWGQPRQRPSPGPVITQGSSLVEQLNQLFGRQVPS